MLRIDGTQIEPVPPFGVGLPPHLLLGMARPQDHFIAVLDVHKAFSIAALAERGWAPQGVAARAAPA